MKTLKELEVLLLDDNDIGILEYRELLGSLRKLKSVSLEHNSIGNKGFELLLPAKRQFGRVKLLLE